MKVQDLLEENLDNLITAVKANGEVIKVSDYEFYKTIISVSKEISKDIIGFFEACTTYIKGFVKETNKYTFPDAVNFHGKKGSKYFDFSIYIREDSIRFSVKK